MERDRKIMDLFEAIIQNDVCTVENIIKEQLKKKPTDVALWLKLCLTELQFPYEDYESALECIYKVHKLCPDNVEALILEAGIKWHSFGMIEKELYDRLNNIQICDVQKKAIIVYLQSLYYCYKEEIDKEKKMIEKSISLYDGFVYPYKELGHILKSESKFIESKNMHKKAVDNVKKVYADEDFYDFTDPEVYIAEFITGVAISDSNYKRLCELANG